MKKSERIAAMFITAGGVWIMFYAWHTLKLGSIQVPDAGLMPFLAGAGLSILGIAWAWISRGKDERPRRFFEPGIWSRPVFSIGLMVIYALAFENIGYITSTLAFMVAWQKLIEKERWGKTIAISILATAAMYALFVYFLKVPIPPELFLR